MARMKQNLWFAVVCAALAGAACTGKQTETSSGSLITEDKSQPSPSGAFTASLAAVDERGTRAWKVVLRDQQGHEVFRSPTNFTARHRTVVTWENQADQLWIYSGDIGTRVYARDAQGAWQERSKAGLTPPAPIQEVYDQLGIKPKPSAS